MTYLRHTTRHLQQTLNRYLGEVLKDLGWTTDSPPFGTSKVAYTARRLDENDRTSITGNLVNLSFEGEPPFTEMELGGGLVDIEHVFFLDVIGVQDAIAVAIAADLMDVLSGRAPTYSEFLKLRDYTVVPDGVARDEYQIEFEDMARTRPDNLSYKRHWQVVSGTARLSYLGSPV